MNVCVCVCVFVLLITTTSITITNNSSHLNVCFRNQQMLHRNLVYLATIADSNQNVQALLPVSIFTLTFTELLHLEVCKLL